MAETRITVYDGKYTLIHDNGVGLRCLRHGEPWRNLVGDSMVLALVQEIEELREPKTIDWDAERRRFEQAAYQHYLKRREAGKVVDCPDQPWTAEELLWRQPNGEYGVLQFNGAWWAWQEALKPNTAVPT